MGHAARMDLIVRRGIFSALALGRITAKAVVDALERRDFSFSDYEKRIRSISIGSVMRRRRLLANRLYSYPTQVSASSRPAFEMDRICAFKGKDDLATL